MTLFQCIVLVVNIISFVISVAFMIFYIYEQIRGTDNAKQLLKKLHIPLSYKTVLIIGYVCLLYTLIGFLGLSILFEKL